MTFSIVGYDPKTKEHGIAVASKFLSVGAVVPFAKAGVGAIATQSWANLDYGVKGLELLEQGHSPQEVFEQIRATDENFASRQIGIVDAKGRGFTFTGDECFDWAGGLAGENYAAQGNILVDHSTVENMEATFLQTEGSLADRLLSALLAGDAAGGDSRGKQSAALLVVKENGSYGGYTDKYIDLRVDDHEDPVVELGRLMKLHKLYFEGTKKEDIVEVSGVLEDEIRELLYRSGHLSREYADHDSILKALESYQYRENFDERVQPKGFVDVQVVEYMRLMK
ncbi:DUF1028 domain-containing protein [Paenisporosarcina cavernae]|uniref:DUF1028 domain-containing protein n=1 Tax=Paenisporosarcina cavernae TaxID=2320858 RepID=A0A385YQG3_9BACL|nr:DUF1028 domain-containing protein [Paenisporosarcina cavernae]AYC28590.1 DUF1028 domain-containing protein [Paenisporosarcina cavernae]